MAHIEEITVPVDFEMTETSKWILRKMLIQILHEPAVLKALLEDLSKQAQREEGKEKRDGHSRDGTGSHSESHGG